MTTLAHAVAIGDNQLTINAPMTAGSFPGWVKIDDELLNVGGQDWLTGTTLVLSSPATATHDNGATVTYAGRPYDANFLAATGGGATEVSVLKTVTVLTDAQIKTLRTATEIVPAPGPNKMIDFIRIILRSNIVVAEGYTGVDAAAQLFIQAGTGPMDVSYVQNDSAYWSGMVGDLFSSSSVVLVGPGLDTTSSSETTQPIGAFSVADFVGPLFIKLDQASNLTGGNAANTLTVTTIYSVIDL